MNNTKNILVAPLNWGLGHATRCIPIINALLQEGFNPIIASDGVALELLKKEFPSLTHLELPSYNIRYSKKANGFKWKLLQNSPKTIKSVVKEKKIVKNWIREYNISGIISDNRFGVYSKKILSVCISHQLNVLSGNTTKLSSMINQLLLQKFDICWVPDFENFPNLSGKLGHLKNTRLKIKYIGALSRFKKVDLPKKYDFMVLLSGPEPQRTLLEEKITHELQKTTETVLFVKGKIEPQQTIENIGTVTYYNFMKTDELEKAFNESEMVLSRSGYTTIMDLAYLHKKAFFIPTPGQPEQEYLARKLKKQGLVPYKKQNDFKLEDLQSVWLYTGLSAVDYEPNWKELFSIFLK